MVKTTDSTIGITLNGQPREIASAGTLSTLIKDLGLGQAAVAAEVNGVVVPKHRHASTPIQDGDRIELVTLVGGG
jgi:sulfur carrier protein